MEKAQERGWSLILPELCSGAVYELRGVQNAVERVQQLLAPRDSPVPSLRAWVDDVRELESEFGEVQLDWEAKWFTVSTAPITLEDVYLGPFSIRFCWDRLRRSAPLGCFDIIALDPQPPAVNELVTHPHVRDETLCAGDAAIPLERAIVDGRLSDAFCLIHGVLTHYNPGSPYVPLDQWFGLECHECQVAMREDEAYRCEDCEHDICSECVGFCTACDQVRCPGCMAQCAVCEQAYCSSCLGECSASARDCCSRCLRACAACGSSVACDHYADNSLICPACAESQAEESDEDLVSSQADSCSLNQTDTTPSEDNHAIIHSPVSDFV
jgi:hypothetical protein